jgi:hypothetical protein
MLSRLTTLRPAIRFRAFNCKFSTRPSQGAGENSKRDLRTGGKKKNNAAENVKSLVAKWQSEGDRYVSYENLAKLDSELAQFTSDRTVKEKANLLSELTLTYFARSDLLRKGTASKPDNLYSRLVFEAY